MQIKNVKLFNQSLNGKLATHLASLLLSSCVYTYKHKHSYAWYSNHDIYFNLSFSAKIRWKTISYIVLNWITYRFPLKFDGKR